MYTGNRFLQPFPPKKFFGNKDEAFLKNRAEMLQKYLTNLVRVSGILTVPAFCRCFEINSKEINA